MLLSAIPVIHERIYGSCKALGDGFRSLDDAQMSTAAAANMVAGRLRGKERDVHTHALRARARAQPESCLAPRRAVRSTGEMNLSGSGEQLKRARYSIAS